MKCIGYNMNCIGAITKLNQTGSNTFCIVTNTFGKVTSARSDQSLRCALYGQLRTQTVRQTANALIRWQMPRLIQVFAGCTCNFVVFCCAAA